MFIKCVVLTFGQCPNFTDIPCNCYGDASFSFVHCWGPFITDEKLATKVNVVSNYSNYYYFNSLAVYGTAVTKLVEDTFKWASFSDIDIQNNENLAKIDANAFINSAQSVKTLGIENNTKLVFDDVKKLMHNLEAVEFAKLRNNRFEEISENAFQPKNLNTTLLNTLYLSGNRIKRIGSYAFFNQSNLFIIDLRDNMIEYIDDYGLTLSKYTGKFDAIYINLNKNNITDKSFANNSLSNPNKVHIDLRIEENKLTTLDEHIFSPFINQNNRSLVYLFGNKFICDCKMKWLFESNNKRFINVNCANKQNTNIFELPSNHFENCTNT